MAKILIVDDDESVRDSMGRLLAIKGHTTIKWPSSTGAEGVIRTMHPDMVLTDNDLGPGEEKGLDLAIRLKDKGIKVLLMSGNDLREEAAEKGILFYKKASPLPLLFSKLKEVCRG